MMAPRSRVRVSVVIVTVLVTQTMLLFHQQLYIISMEAVEKGLIKESSTKFAELTDQKFGPFAANTTGLPLFADTASSPTEALREQQNRSHSHAVDELFGNIQTSSNRDTNASSSAPLAKPSSLATREERWKPEKHGVIPSRTQISATWLGGDVNSGTNAGRTVGINSQNQNNVSDHNKSLTNNGSVEARAAASTVKSQLARQRRVAEVCQNHRKEIEGRVEKVFIYPEASGVSRLRPVAYCSTHKVASTFWLRVYRWLYNDTRPGHVRSPLDIPKLDVHLLPLTNLKVHNLTAGVTTKVQDMVNASFRFLFTREPFARLWSVYLDKFLLPDNYFWNYYTPLIKLAVRSSSAGRLAKTGNRGNELRADNLVSGSPWTFQMLFGDEVLWDLGQLPTERKVQHNSTAGHSDHRIKDVQVGEMFTKASIDNSTHAAPNQMPNDKHHLLGNRPTERQGPHTGDNFTHQQLRQAVDAGGHSVASTVSRRLLSLGAEAGSSQPKAGRDENNQLSIDGQGSGAVPATIVKAHTRLPPVTRNPLVPTGQKQNTPFLVGLVIHRILCQTVTFEEFLQYIVRVASGPSTAQELDDHFRPVHCGCNPCQYRPDFIGKMETMKEDSREVLRTMQLDDLAESMISSSSIHVQHEVEMLVDFNFELVVEQKLQSNCVSNADLERRLIHTFVYNGYIDIDDARQLEKRLPLGQTRLKQAVMDLHERSNRTASDVRKYRSRYKQMAYSQIPTDLLYAVQKVFYWDFKLFGYDPFPADIFNR